MLPSGASIQLRITDLRPSFFIQLAPANNGGTIDDRRALAARLRSVLLDPENVPRSFQRRAKQWRSNRPAIVAVEYVERIPGAVYSGVKPGTQDRATVPLYMISCWDVDAHHHYRKLLAEDRVADGGWLSGCTLHQEDDNYTLPQLLFNMKPIQYCCYLSIPTGAIEWVGPTAPDCFAGHSDVEWTQHGLAPYRKRAALHHDVLRAAFSSNREQSEDGGGSEDQDGKRPSGRSSHRGGHRSGLSTKNNPPSERTTATSDMSDDDDDDDATMNDMDEMENPIPMCSTLDQLDDAIQEECSHPTRPIWQQHQRCYAMRHHFLTSCRRRTRGIVEGRVPWMALSKLPGEYPAGPIKKVIVDIETASGKVIRHTLLGRKKPPLPSDETLSMDHAAIPMDSPSLFSALFSRIPVTTVSAPPYATDHITTKRLNPAVSAGDAKSDTSRAGPGGSTAGPGPSPPSSSGEEFRPLDVFPDPNRDADPIVMIQTSVWIYGDSQPSLDILHSLMPAVESPELAQAIKFRWSEPSVKNEHAMLSHWCHLVAIQLDFEWLLTWNGIGYDLPYLFIRGEKLKCERMKRLGRYLGWPDEAPLTFPDDPVATRAASYDEIARRYRAVFARAIPKMGRRLKRENSNDYDFPGVQVYIPGLLQMDEMKVTKGMATMETYRLKEVAKKWLKGGSAKRELKANLIGPTYATNAVYRAIVERYGMADIRVPGELACQRQMIPQVTEQSALTMTSIHDLLFRGQQKKTWNQLVRWAHENGWLLNEEGRQRMQRAYHVPVDEKKAYLKTSQERSAEQSRKQNMTKAEKSKARIKYTGGFVLEPAPGYHDDEIATEDFNSLYPTVIIAYNLDWSTWTEHRYDDQGRLWFPLYGATYDECWRNHPTRFVTWKLCDLEPTPAEAAGRDVILVVEDWDSVDQAKWDAFQYWTKLKQKFPAMPPFAPTDAEGGRPSPTMSPWVPSSEQRVPKATYCFVQNRVSMLPKILARLLERRGAVKKLHKAAEEAHDSFMASVYENRQLALKLAANASYGFAGAVDGFFGGAAIAAATCLLGRFNALVANWTAEEFFGKSIYGDTDSIFVKFLFLTLRCQRRLASDTLEGLKSEFLSLVENEQLVRFLIRHRLVSTIPVIQTWCPANPSEKEQPAALEKRICDELALDKKAGRPTTLDALRALVRGMTEEKRWIPLLNVEVRRCFVFIQGKALADTISKRCKPPMKIELEKILIRCAMWKKKMYAYIKDDGKLVTKGLSTVRRDYPLFVRSLHGALLSMMMSVDPSVIRACQRSMIPDAWWRPPYFVPAPRPSGSATPALVPVATGAASGGTGGESGSGGRGRLTAQQFREMTRVRQRAVGMAGRGGRGKLGLASAMGMRTLSFGTRPGPLTSSTASDASSVVPRIAGPTTLSTSPSLSLSPATLSSPLPTRDPLVWTEQITKSMPQLDQLQARVREQLFLSRTTVMAIGEAESRAACEQFLKPVRSTIERLIHHQISYEDIQRTAARGEKYANTNLPQVQAFLRDEKRRGIPRDVGERIAFLMVQPRTVKRRMRANGRVEYEFKGIANQAEEVNYAEDERIPIYVMYYLHKVLMQKVRHALSLIMSMDVLDAMLAPYSIQIFHEDTNQRSILDVRSQWLKRDAAPPVATEIEIESDHSDSDGSKNDEDDDNDQDRDDD